MSDFEVDRGLPLAPEPDADAASPHLGNTGAETETAFERDLRSRVEEHRSERHARLKARAEAKAAAAAQARSEAAERARLKAEAAAEAKEAERIRARERAEARAAAEAAAREAARAKAEAKARGREPVPAGPPVDVTGRQRMIDAAMRLHSEKRSFASLGIREIAREANLNPNTFYRHFESIDDLAAAAVTQVGDRLRPMLQQIQRLASRVDPVTVAALEVSAFFAFVVANPEPFVVGVTEYHCGSQRVRDSIAALLHDVAADLRDDITALGIFPTVAPDKLEIACTAIVVHLFHLSQEYIERPERRAYIIESSESMIVWMFAGAAIGTPANLASLNQLLALRPPP